MKATKAAWVQAIAVAALALCVLVLTVDVLFVQWRISQAVDGLGQQLGQLVDQWGGGADGPLHPAPCEPDPATGEIPEGDC